MPRMPLTGALSPAARSRGSACSAATWRSRSSAATMRCRSGSGTPCCSLTTAESPSETLPGSGCRNLRGACSIAGAWRAGQALGQGGHGGQGDRDGPAADRDVQDRGWTGSARDRDGRPGRGERGRRVEFWQLDAPAGAAVDPEGAVARRRLLPRSRPSLTVRDLLNCPGKPAMLGKEGTGRPVCQAAECPILFRNDPATPEIATVRNFIGFSTVCLS